MKKFLTLILAIIFVLPVAFVLSACNNAKKETSKVVGIEVSVANTSQYSSAFKDGYITLEEKPESFTFKKADFKVELIYENNTTKSTSKFNVQFNAEPVFENVTEDQYMVKIAYGKFERNIDVFVKKSAEALPNFLHLTKTSEVAYKLDTIINFTGSEISVLDYLSVEGSSTNLATLISDGKVVIVHYQSNVVRATEVGTYSCIVRAEDGYYWATAAGNISSFILEWEIS